MTPTPQITREVLIARRAGTEPPLLIDVLPEEEFQGIHLPGAKNACVYNITFLDDVAKLAKDRATPLVVYGSSPRNLASVTAAEKLTAAGYTQVADYRGGLEEWRSAGQPIEGNGIATSPIATPRDGTHKIDLEKSKIEWIGRNLMGAHNGTIKLAGGQIEISNGRPVSGAFTIDMTTIDNADLEDSGMRRMLIHHLKSDDFFDVERFPKAEFQLTRITPIPDAVPSSPNCEITGNLTLKATSRDLSFRAILAPTPAGLLAADAHFDIDRTQWKVLYGSGKFYEKLGKHLVNDEITLGLKLITLPFAT